MSQAPISFEGFQFDAGTGELSGPSGRVRLGPQPARLLAVLVQRPGELVTRDELKRALWPDTTVEADQGLNFCILQLRSALGDEAAKARYIETLPRRGYRFIATIDRSEVVDDPAEGLSAAARRRSRTPRHSLLFATTLVCVALAAWALVIGRSVNRNVAIMPLLPRADDPAWVAEVGSTISDLLVTRFTAQDPGRIGVVGPLTTRRYVGDTMPLKELGRSLGVGYVLSGGVRASDSTVFIQVVRVSDGVHVCAFRRPAVGVNLDTLVSSIVASAASKVASLGPRQATDHICGPPRQG